MLLNDRIRIPLDPPISEWENWCRAHHDAIITRAVDEGIFPDESEAERHFESLCEQEHDRLEALRDFQADRGLL